MLNEFLSHVSRLALSTGAVLALTSVPALAQGPTPTGGAAVLRPDLPATPAQQSQGTTLQLTMEQAVDLALQNNLGLQSSRMNLDIAAYDIVAARSAFLPRTQASFSRNSQSQPALLNPDGTRQVSTSTSLNSSTSFSQALPWFGTSYSVNWNAGRRETPGATSTFNPSLNSAFSFNITQPLWRGLKTDGNRTGLESSQRQQVIEDLALQQAIVSLDVQTRSAYLDLVAARENQKVAEQNLQLSEDALSNTRARIRVGVAPETDIISDEASVANSRVRVIASELSIAQAEDNLRRIILDPNRPDFWDVSLMPSDTPELTERAIDLEQTIQNAMDGRLDRIIAARQLDLTNLSLRVSEDNTRPDLNVSVNYSASASGGRASSGTDLGFGSVLNQTFAGDFPSWTTQLQFNYPLGNTAAEASLARAQIQRQQVLIQMRDLDLFIVQQVRNAVRQVENSYRQVEASRVALRASEQNLDAENRKFGVGLSTSLDLQIRQRDLATARVNELSAIIGYNRALIELDRVQKVR